MDVTEGKTASSTAGPSRASLVLTALSFGLAAGAVALAGYAYAARVPDGQSESYLEPASALLLWSLIAVGLVAATTVVLGVLAWRGRAQPAYGAWLFAVVVGIAAYGYLGRMPNDRVPLISGPGARPVMALAQLGWVVAAAALLALLAAAIFTQTSSPRRPLAAGFAVAGIVVALVAGTVVIASSSVGNASATTAAPTPIPAVPTSVGTDVAYTLRLPSPLVLPAGPGFVTVTNDAVVAYDGATGAERWRMPVRDLPDRCKYDQLFSTGTADGAVVVVECLRPPNTTTSDERSREPSEHEYAAFLVGLDAVTGERLWINADDWWLMGRANVDGDALAGVSRDEVAAIDPRTGTPLWTQPRPAAKDCGGDWYDSSGASIVFLEGCAGTFHVIDATGDVTLDLEALGGFGPTETVRKDVLAAAGDVVAVSLQTTDRPDADSVAVIDTRTKSMELLRTGYVSSLLGGEALMPGPVLELGTDFQTKVVTLYLMADRRTVQVTGIDTYNDPRVQRWAVVGDRLVTGLAYQNLEENYVLSSAPLGGGPVVTTPNPCGRDTGGIVPVPGAVLMVCGRYAPGATSVSSYEVLGLR